MVIELIGGIVEYLRGAGTFGLLRAKKFGGTWDSGFSALQDVVN